MTRTPHSELTPQETLRWTRIGMLAALAMLLGYLETFVPIPIPGVKLGLANIAILIALAQGDIGGAFGIATIKVLASGLLFGSPITMAYSAVGTLFAFVLMAPLSHVPGMHVIALSVVGAVAHELGQLVVAMLLLGTPLVWYSAPMLLVAGCVTGALCGLVASSTVALLQRSEDEAARECVQKQTSNLRTEHSQKPWQTAHAKVPSSNYPERATWSTQTPENADGEVHAGCTSTGDSPRIHLEASSLEPSSCWAEPKDKQNGASLLSRNSDARKPMLDGRIAFVGFAAYCVFALRATTASALACCLAVAVVGCVAGRVRVPEVMRALRPLLPILLITLIAQVASTQHGTMVFALGPVVITREALAASVTLLARLLALTLASLAVMRLASLESLVEAVAWLLAPLKRLGLRVDGFILALQSALRFLPTLAAMLGDNARLLRAQLGSRELWTDTFPQLIAQLYRDAGTEKSLR